MNRIGKYEIAEQIGSGGMGLVYRAYDPDIDRQVAIKLINERALEIPSVKARFQREARTAGKLSHPNITIVYDLAEIDGKIYIVMEYLNGRDLRSIIDSQPSLSLGAKIELVEQICAGLQYAHAEGVVHRDIKPENVMVLPNGRVKILDFGIAKPDTRGRKDDGSHTMLTQEGARIGTPWYMSPEQVRGAVVDLRSDIFSVGVLFYEFLTYRKPFDGDDTTVMYKILSVEPEPIVIHEGDLVDDLRRVVSKCLAKEVKARYQDCGELSKDLGVVLEKIKRGKWITELLAEAQQLSLSRQTSDAMLKLNQVLQIEPNHEEARRRVRQLIEKEQESATVKIIDGRIIGQTVSHYRILERLGGGGMGVVYKVEDTNLKRTVALKFLLPELTRDEGAKKRFLTEARAASALDHPNICTIHEINETDEGLLFICMAFYEGETLASQVSKGLDIDMALNIMVKVAAGLAKAHEHGIVHRDIKPANVILTAGGEVKIVDFGLAKLSGATRITKTGTTMGTLPYMSPEQIRGEELDHRSDIWSLGVMLYQLLTGKLPFLADYEAAILYAILNTDPIPACDLNRDIDETLETMIAKTLKKNLAERYQSTEELLKDLSAYARKRARSSSPPVPTRESQTRPTVERLLEDAEAFITAGRVDRAIEVYNEVIKLDPGNERLRELFKNMGEARVGGATPRPMPIKDAGMEKTVALGSLRDANAATPSPSPVRRRTTLFGSRKKTFAFSMPAVAAAGVLAWVLWLRPGPETTAVTGLSVVADVDCILIDPDQHRTTLSAGRPVAIDGAAAGQRFEVWPRDYPIFSWTAAGDRETLEIKPRFANTPTVGLTLSGNYGNVADKIEDGLVINGFRRPLSDFKNLKVACPKGAYDIRFALPDDRFDEGSLEFNDGITRTSMFRFDFSSYRKDKAYIAFVYRKASIN